MSLITFLQEHMFTCPSRKYLHMECPGCGMQRSILCLLRGDLRGSLAMHPAAIPALMLFGFLPLHLLLKLNWGPRLIITLVLTFAVITVAFYIYKVINHKILV